MDDRRFECPECGSHMFGSSGMGENMMIHCHGDEQINCGYSAPHGDPAHWVPEPVKPNTLKVQIKDHAGDVVKEAEIFVAPGDTLVVIPEADLAMHDDGSTEAEQILEEVRMGLKNGAEAMVFGRPVRLQVLTVRAREE